MVANLHYKKECGAAKNADLTYFSNTGKDAYADKKQACVYFYKQRIAVSLAKQFTA